MKGIFKNKSFMLMMFGKLVSLFGNSIFDIAIIWYVLSKYSKDSGTMLGLIMVMTILPSVIFGGVLGSFIDRFNKKLVMIGADTLSGIIVLGVVMLMSKAILNSAELLLSIGLLALATSTVRIAVNSIIPDLFQDKELYDANAANQFIERGTSLLGYALGGGLIALIGVEKAILLNGISFIICAFSEGFINLPKNILIKGISKGQNMIEDFRDTMRFLKSERTLIWVVTIFMGVNFLLDPILNIAVPYVLKNEYKISLTFFGLIISSLPLGFCIGAIYFSKKPKFLRSQNVLFYSILGINTMFMLFSIPIIMSSYFTRFPWIPFYFMVFALLSGIFSAAINISASVAIQKLVPEHIRGKFMGINSSIAAGLLPLGGIIVGDLIGKVNYSSIFLFSILMIYVILIIIPKRKYSLVKDMDSIVVNRPQI